MMAKFENITVDFPDIILNMTSVGIVGVDRLFIVILWNRFMEMHSNIRQEEILGRNLFEVFPEINRNWLEKKVRSCMILKTPSFTSWKQRPYLFRFKAGNVAPDGFDFMHQDTSIWPIRDSHGTIQGACISVQDVSEIAESLRLLETAMDETLALEECSQRDALTGLFNRRFFDEQITQEIHRARHYCWPLGLAMLDIDYFKKVNDTYGHPVGDLVLRAVASRLTSLLRSSDTLCRYGGEEFALILPQISKEHVLPLVRRLCSAVEENPVVLENGLQVVITLSAGVAQLSENQVAGELIQFADQALYLSKQQGRNRVTCL